MRAIPCVGKVFTDEMHHQRSDNAVPGDNAGLNIKGLDNAVSNTQGLDNADVHMDICERLTAVEAALRLQLAAGTSHLQEIEMAPGAFGLSAAARPAIKAIRKRRNAALHVVGPGQVEKQEKNVVPRGHLGRGKGISALTKGARPGQAVKLPPNDDVAFVQSLIQAADDFAASW